MARWIEKRYSLVSLAGLDRDTMANVFADMAETILAEVERLKALPPHGAEIAVEIRLLDDGANMSAPFDAELKLMHARDVRCTLSRIALSRPGADKLVLARLFKKEETRT